MSKAKAAELRYLISIEEDPEAPGSLRFTFVPRRLHATRPGSEPLKPVPRYILSVPGFDENTGLSWIAPPPKATVREELESMARERVTARHAWLDRVQMLVTTINEWARELGWSTRVVEKRMEDAEIGSYKTGALLLQEQTTRLLLEPVARSAPGTEGLVDLCLMPSYDDVASLYYDNGRWNVQYLFKGTPEAENIREVEARPLTKATLRKVLDEMKAHAE